MKPDVFFDRTKREFSYLVDEYAFVKSHDIDFNSNISAVSAYTSKDCSLRIFLDKAEWGGIQFGPADAQIIPSIDQPQVWYDLLDIIGLIEGWGVDEEWAYRFYGKRDMSTGELIESTAEKMRPYCKRIEQMFSKKEFQSTKGELDKLQRGGNEYCQDYRMKKLEERAKNENNK
jgi:hypothetical protein